MGSDVLDGYKHFIATEKRYRKKPWTFCNDCSHGIWNPHLHRSTCKFDKTLEWCELWHEWAEYVREFERRNKRKERTCNLEGMTDRGWERGFCLTST